MVELQEIFDIKYGNSLDLNKLTQCKIGINFVSRTSKNNGVSAIVDEVIGLEKMPEGSITVSLGGSVLEAFLQPKVYYTGYHIYCLTPKENITLSNEQKLFYCACIRANKYKYSYGRQANRTLRSLIVPSIDEIPSWVNDVDLTRFNGADNSISQDVIELNTLDWKSFKFRDLFNIKKGKRLTKANMILGNTPFIGSTDNNNGLTAKVNLSPIHDGNVITVNYNGSVGKAFYQPEAFWASDDVNVLYPRKSEFDTFDQYIACFIIPLIELNKFRFNYGRKWHKERMEETILKLPVNNEGKPNITFMQKYIKSLPYSKSI